LDLDRADAAMAAGSGAAVMAGNTAGATVT